MGKAYVELGAPLMAILQPSERLAVLAHELSHGANGDPLRSMYLQGAVNTLASWGTSARPPGIGTLGDGMPFGPIISLLGIPIDLLMLAVSEALFAAARGLLLLVMRQSQRAEYKADLLAASVAGSKEMMTALEKTYLGDSVLESVRRHALLTPYEP
ncbi:peptidase, partial [sediment metagenome]